MFCDPIKKVYVRTTNNSFMKGIDSMRKRNIIAAILMLAMTTSLFTGCKPSVPDDGTNTTEQGNTSATTEATTAEVQKAPVTLYANFDNEVLNDAPTTLPDDGFYYKAFTSIAVDRNRLQSWAGLLSPLSFYGDLLGTSWDEENRATDTDSFIGIYKDSNIRYAEVDGESCVLADEDYEKAKKKLNINNYFSFCEEFFGKNGGIYETRACYDTPEYYDYDKLDAEVMPQVTAIAEAWLKANFMGETIPEEMTTEDFKTYVDTNAAYAYFASMGALPYEMTNDGITRENYTDSGYSEKMVRGLYSTDMVAVWAEYDYTNFMMTCHSKLSFKTENGQEGSSTVKFIVIIKPEKNDDGSWSFKLDYASFIKDRNAMDKWGTVSAPKAHIEIINEAYGY